MKSTDPQHCTLSLRSVSLANNTQINYLSITLSATQSGQTSEFSASLPHVADCLSPCSFSSFGFQELGKDSGWFALQLFRIKHTLQTLLKLIQIILISFYA